MKLAMTSGFALAVLSSGCVRYVQVPQQGVTVSAHLQINGSPPATPLAAVPDIPTMPGARVDAETIHQALDHQGTWIDDVLYGTVWYPPQDVRAHDFVPYGTNGHWVLTDAGWYWQSGYQWGWLTFHYGRWVMVEQRWAWVPGGMFAPAWVDWRVGDGYVGWAALPPRGASFSAPYGYCQYSQLSVVNVWSQVLYGPSGEHLYNYTNSVRSSYGIGGAVYSWGPTPARSSGVTPVSVAPIATAWRTEVGVPLQQGRASGGANPNGPVHVAPIASNQPLPATGPAMPGTPLPNTGPSADSGPHRVAAPYAGSWGGGRVDSVQIASGSGVGNAPDPAYGRYRTADAVVIGSSVPAARLRETVSLGTTEPTYVPPVLTAPQPVNVSSYAPPPVVAPTRGYTPPTMVPSYGSSPPMSAFNTQVSTFTPPPGSMGGSWNPGASAYRPQYAAPAPTYAPPAQYTAPAPPPSTYAPPPSVPSYAPQYTAPMAAPVAAPYVPPQSRQVYAPAVAPAPVYNNPATQAPSFNAGGTAFSSSFH